MMRAFGIMASLALVAGSSHAASDKDWMTLELKGIHPFVGLGIMGGASLPFALEIFGVAFRAASQLSVLRQRTESFSAFDTCRRV